MRWLLILVMLTGCQDDRGLSLFTCTCTNTTTLAPAAPPPHPKPRRLK